MNNQEPGTLAEQQDLFYDELSRTLLDQLFADSKLYRQSTDYKELLDFVVKLRGFAPFNAMLLQVQRPGLSYAASVRDWRLRFNRQPKESARPLLILWPFGPVALVYDVMDTEGDPLPEDVASFVASGGITQEQLRAFEILLKRKRISCFWIDAGDHSAGSIRVAARGAEDKGTSHYRIDLNQNHEAAVQYCTLVHELGHLFLGHLGPDKKLKVPERRRLEHAKREIEAESVAYIVCERSGVHPKSQSYLSNFVQSDTSLEDLDIYQVMRAAGQVETILGIATRSRFDRTSHPGTT